MFSGSQHFVVTGGTFHNITNNYTTAPTVPPGTFPHPSDEDFLNMQKTSE
jgi:hypothetical protein